MDLLQWNNNIFIIKLDNYFFVSVDRQTFLCFEMTSNLCDTSPLTVTECINVFSITAIANDIY